MVRVQVKCFNLLFHRMVGADLLDESGAEDLLEMDEGPPAHRLAVLCSCCQMPLQRSPKSGRQTRTCSVFMARRLAPGRCPLPVSLSHTLDGEPALFTRVKTRVRLQHNHIKSNLFERDSDRGATDTAAGDHNATTLDTSTFAPRAEQR